VTVHSTFVEVNPAESPFDGEVGCQMHLGAEQEPQQTATIRGPLHKPLVFEEIQFARTRERDLSLEEDNSYITGPDCTLRKRLHRLAGAMRMECKRRRR
jgi:hypothetical protein